MSERDYYKAYKKYKHKYRQIAGGYQCPEKGVFKKKKQYVVTLRTGGLLYFKPGCDKKNVFGIDNLKKLKVKKGKDHICVTKDECEKKWGGMIDENECFPKSCLENVDFY